MLFALKKIFVLKVETFAFAKNGRKKWDMYKKVYWFIGINIFESSIYLIMQQHISDFSFHEYYSIYFSS